MDLGNLVGHFFYEQRRLEPPFGTGDLLLDASRKDVEREDEEQEPLSFLCFRKGFFFFSFLLFPF